jgi:hypothetical protein
MAILLKENFLPEWDRQIQIDGNLQLYLAGEKVRVAQMSP